MISTVDELNNNQNREENIELLAAQRVLYNEARIYELLIFILTIVIPTLILFIKIFFENNNLFKEVSNIIPIITMLIYIFIYDKNKDIKNKAAYIQQLFDSKVYDINFGIKMEDIENSYTIFEKSKKILNSEKEKNKLHNWYNIDIRCNKLSSFKLILSCQIINIFWSKELKQKYINIISFIILIPILILLIINIKLYKINFIVSAISYMTPLISFFYINIKNVKNEIKELQNVLSNIEIKLNSDNITEKDIIKIQNSIFKYRKNSVLIFNIFYNFYKQNIEIILKKYFGKSS
ncbi:hypothetical protein EPJ64_08810 [Brachyspira aalborgi]|jgi:hypothetical protein|uniref:Uncharacterized protein n=1 Tax=Brachyspira aalborgi TaxID=29522 RepID=A0AB38PYC6_9SPIR|nr:S-4TM family putative pore-forming effector [Brachyspira aalborgi]MBS4762977.1 hypothetical protein [Brachyspira sp.]CCY76553.1 gram-positive signal peptide protein YSIRK family [Brachyspira sp. CAG:700]TXJ15343.1 hypothetical protein EPJ77_09410 [Brachyspira aalborgi]TXJ18020.1 hypothetical protein EPJ64_08810 [Brachyspira aalborgi]TXJ23973.1 hypothetical protein EPJ73_08890 [Brachyspira aalborgi]